VDYEKAEVAEIPQAMDGSQEQAEPIHRRARLLGSDNASTPRRAQAFFAGLGI